MSEFAENLEMVNRRVESACRRAGRAVSSVRILAVAKTFGPERVTEAAECGVVTIGESKVREAERKMPMCPGRLRWHMVGHLQRNKVRDAVRLFEMIHSVDSLRLLEKIDTASSDAGRVMPVLIEVNVSGEQTKHGLAPEETPAVLEKSQSLMNIDLRGLMTIPPFAPDPEGARPYFARLRELRDRWRSETGFDLNELSMGMSSDFEQAVEEGATWLRLGTILFGRRSAVRDAGNGAS